MVIKMAVAEARAAQSTQSRDTGRQALTDGQPGGTKQSVNGVADRQVSAVRSRRRSKWAACTRWKRHWLQALRTVSRESSSAMVMQAKAERAGGA